MSDENPNRTDHDLLITLHANFDSFQKFYTAQMTDLNAKIAQFLVAMEQKATKSDFNHLESLLKNHNDRLTKIEDEHKTVDVKKETTINFGKFGVGTVKFLLGIAVALIAIYQFFYK